jgi:hypothetical protein
MVYCPRDAGRECPSALHPHKEAAMRLLRALLLSTALVSSSYAGLIGTTSVDLQGSATPAIPHQTRAGATFGLVGYPFDPGLFDDTVLTEASLGLVLTATAVNDLDFAGIVATMTNGTEEEMLVFTTLGNGTIGLRDTEKNLFSLGTDDFAGANIDAITLTIDAISFDTDVDTTHVSVQYSLRVYEDFLVPVAQSTWGKIKALYR